jgi:hypothetical protein
MSDEQPKAVAGVVVDEREERKRKARARKAAALQLKLDVFAMRRAGSSFQHIADQFDISKTRAHQIVSEALNELSAQLAHSVEHYRALELARLDLLLTRLDAKTKTQPFAVIAYLKVMERRAKLLGLDRPLRLSLESGTAPERELTDDALNREITHLQRQLGDASSRRLQLVEKKGA